MMMNEEMNLNMVELNDEELESVSGGKHSYITGDNGKSNVRTGPGLNYRALGVLHRGESLKYLHDTSIDDRGVMWYKVRFNGNTAWVSSRYTMKERF
ncbi:MAG: SH3 domain-containing protein [bacterium]